MFNKQKSYEPVSICFSNKSHNCPQNGLVLFYNAVLSPKDVDGMPNIVCRFLKGFHFPVKQTSSHKICLPFKHPMDAIYL